MSQHLERGMLLYQQDRYPEAIEQFRQAVIGAPTSAWPHAWLALALVGAKQPAAALAEAEQAIAHGPDLAFAHQVHAQVLLALDKPKPALAASGQALALAPEEPHIHALRSAILFRLERWDEARQAAESGLALDPLHVDCANLRAQALRQLGQEADADHQLRAALYEQPDNAWTHTNLGYNHLHAGRYQEALHCFREALRLDPTFGAARAGIVEALKARHPAYALMLKFFVRMSRFTGRTQWMLAIGIVVALQVFSRVGRDYPRLEPWVDPLLIGYSMFVFAVWLAVPFFNLLLFLDPLGRHALSRVQRRTALWTGAGMLWAGTLIGLYVWRTTNFIPWLVLLPLLLLFPLIITCGVRPGKWRWLAIAYTAVVALAFHALFVGVDLLSIYVWGCILANWLGHLLPREESWD